MNISTNNGLFNKVEFDAIPGVELSNFAVNDDYREKQDGMKVIYIFALPENNLINRYKEMNFHRLSKKQERAVHRRIKPAYDKNCIFMYQVIN